MIRGESMKINFAMRSNVLFDTWRIPFFGTSGNNYGVCACGIHGWKIGKPGNQLTITQYSKQYNLSI